MSVRCNSITYQLRDFARRHGRQLVNHRLQGPPLHALSQSFKEQSPIGQRVDKGGSLAQRAGLVVGFAFYPQRPQTDVIVAASAARFSSSQVPHF